jgi:hypothetical protein
MKCILRVSIARKWPKFLWYNKNWLIYKFVWTKILEMSLEELSEKSFPCSQDFNVPNALTRPHSPSQNFLKFVPSNVQQSTWEENLTKLDMDECWSRVWVSYRALWPKWCTHTLEFAKFYSVFLSPHQTSIHIFGCTFVGALSIMNLQPFTVIGKNWLALEVAFGSSIELMLSCQL